MDTNGNIRNLFLPYNLALLAKEKGFDEPTPHCYIHIGGEKYTLELFSFFLGGEGVLSEIYEDEKKERRFKIFDLNNEEYVYFNYNQDLRKLIARLYNGHEYMNDEKSYNMNIDSYTYEKWSVEEKAGKKLLLPNYNNGDFDFTVYSDVISAPLYQQIIDWILKKLKENYEDISITYYSDYSGFWTITDSWEIHFDNLDKAIEEAFKLI